MPAGTPEEVKQTLLEAFRQGFEDEGFRKVMKDRNVSLSWLEGEEFVNFVADQTEFFGGVVEKYDIKAQ